MASTYQLTLHDVAEFGSVADLETWRAKHDIQDHINSRDRIGRLPLLLAVENANSAASEFLLDMGCDIPPMEKSDDHRFPNLEWRFACRNGMSSVLSKFLDRWYPKQRESSSNTPSDILRDDPSSLCNDTHPPPKALPRLLMESVSKGHADCAAVLLDRPWSTHGKIKELKLLHHAGSPDMVRALITHGYSMKDEFRPYDSLLALTPLQHAARAGRHAVVRAMLELLPESERNDSRALGFAVQTARSQVGRRQRGALLCMAELLAAGSVPFEDYQHPEVCRRFEKSRTAIVQGARHRSMDPTDGSSEDEEKKKQPSAARGTATGARTVERAGSKCSGSGARPGAAPQPRSPAGQEAQSSDMPKPSGPEPNELEPEKLDARRKEEEEGGERGEPTAARIARSVIRSLYEGGGDPYRCLKLLFRFCRGVAGMMRDVARLDPWKRGWVMCRWRRAVEAKRDAGMVFQAASEGRPLELAKRLRLGKLAGGLVKQGVISDAASGVERRVGPLEAAQLGGHDECVRVLEEAMK